MFYIRWTISISSNENKQRKRAYWAFFLKSPEKGLNEVSLSLLSFNKNNVLQRETYIWFSRKIGKKKKKVLPYNLNLLELFHFLLKLYSDFNQPCSTQQICLISVCVLLQHQTSAMLALVSGFLQQQTNSCDVDYSHGCQTPRCPGCCEWISDGCWEMALKGDFYLLPCQPVQW